MANPGVKGCGPTSRHFRCKAVGTGDAGAGGSTGWEEKGKRESGLLAGPTHHLTSTTLPGVYALSLAGRPHVLRFLLQVRVQWMIRICGVMGGESLRKVKE